MPGRRSVLALTAVLLTALPLIAQDGSDLFDLTKTSMDRTVAAKVAADLVEYAQAQAAAAPEYHILGEYRKLVRIAYQLSKEGPSVAAAHARIKNGNAPEAPKREVSREALMKALVGLAASAREGRLAHDLAAARFLCSVGLLVDPGNEACLAEWEKVSKRGGGEIRWDLALAPYRRAIPDGTTCGINGLAISTAGGTAQVGSVSRIVLTYRASAAQTIAVQLLREEEDQTKVSADEAIRYWNRVRKNVPLPGGLLEISFEDKFSKKGGPSAGAAYAVLLRAFSDPFQIDPLTAMTGDVSVEGRVLPVGGVHAKIRGAVMAGCKRVGIPVSDEGELTDAVVINGPATLAEIEVIGLDTVDDAIAMARADRDERAKSATAAFAGLRELVEKKLRSPDAVKPAEIQKLTDAILAASPRHVSARLLDAWNNRRLPAKLSLAASLDETHNVIHGYLTAIRSGENPDFKDINTESKTANIVAFQQKLAALTPKLHADAQKPAEKLSQVCLTIQRFIQLRPGLENREKKIKALEKEIDELKMKVDRAKAENKPPDEVNRLVKRHNSKVEEQNEHINNYKKADDERKGWFTKVIDHYNDYVVMIRTLTQDPKLLEKLQHGR